MALVNYKLILMIQAFSSDEIDKFKKFISSPFFSKGRNYLPYLDHVLKISKNSNSDVDINEEKLVLSIVSKKFSEQTLRNRYSELYKLGEEFLIYTGLTENKAESEKLLLQKLLDKKLYIPFKIKHKETFKYLSEEKFDMDNLQHSVNLNELYSVFLLNKNKVDMIYHEYYNYSNLVLCQSLLNLFTMGLEFIQQELNSIKSKPNNVRVYLKNLNIDKMMSSFRNIDSVLFKVTSMYYNLYMACDDRKNENHYFESRKIFTEVYSDLTDDFKTVIFSRMINYCIRYQNEGIKKFKQELFNLYSEKLNQNLIADLKNNNYLFNHFRDYVYIGFELKKNEWVENFIKKYSPELPIEIRNDETKISYAKLNFEKKKYVRSLLDLENVNAIHYLMYLDSSILKLCNYYELKRFENSYLEIDKLNHYMRSHKEIPISHKQNCVNFLSIYKKLLKIKTEPENKNIVFLKNEFDNVKLISRRRWLEDKINELLN